MASTVQEFVDQALYIIESCTRVLLNDVISTETIEANTSRLTGLLRNTRRVARTHPEVERLSSILERMLAELTEQKRLLNPEGRLFAAKTRPTGGRPLYVISRDQLVYLVEAGFTTTQMAAMLHVSKASVKRRLRLYGISIRSQYSTISDAELDAQVKDIVQDNHALGQRMVQGTLQAQGHRVQRQRVADSLVRVDEAAVAMRWCRSIQRRVYRVSSPNALWHIDGNHKLIRWGFVIHGGIDGYSRLNVFLNIATNNKSETMLDAFVKGTKEYGTPSRVRADHGLENVGVGAFMLAYRGTGRGSFITGRSVHNQRIERLWRDLFQSCTNVFHRLFTHLEESGDLDLSNDLHMWCLHYVFLPRLQRSLNTFRSAWNNHSLTSERGKTPKQIFIEGILLRAGQGHRGVDDLVYEPPQEPLPEPEQDYGVDETGAVPEREEHEPRRQDVSSVPQPLSAELYEQLKTQINPLVGTDLGIQLYRQTVEFCQQNM